MPQHCKHLVVVSNLCYCGKGAIIFICTFHKKTIDVGSLPVWAAGVLWAGLLILHNIILSSGHLFLRATNCMMAARKDCRLEKHG